MTEQVGSEGPAVGMLRCTGCNRWYAPEDMAGFDYSDFLKFALECRGCFRQRTGKESY